MNKILYKYCYLLLLNCILFLSCNKERDYLTTALQLAGNNRPELEKVLAHYSINSNDSLKLQAAKFLIENMPAHYSFKEPNVLTLYYDAIDSVYEIYKELPLNELIKTYDLLSLQYNTDSLKPISDVKHLSADYLIRNIENAFDVRQKGNWSTHVDFEDFCEYILPYKCIDGQTPDDWREYSKTVYSSGLDVLNYCALYKNLAFKACEVVNLELNKQLHPRIVLQSASLPVKRLRSAFHKPFGNCHDYGFIATAVLRAEGIPAAIDYTPQWPFRSMGHSWNVLLDNFGKNVIFVGCFSRLGQPHKEDHPMVKVFRESYAINREIEKIYAAENNVPPAFKNPCIKDVTDEYMKTYEIEVKIKDKTSHQYAYLAVFNNRNWIPVQWGKTKGNKVVFPKMGGNAVYLPVYYDKNGIIPMADPFILTATGCKKVLIPNTKEGQNLQLYRKYPLFSDIFYFYKRVIGAKIQASNYSDFRDSITLRNIQPAEIQTGIIEFPNENKPYRYWRYLSPDSSYCSLAELYFFEKNNHDPIYGRIIGTEGSFKNQGNVKERVFDQDIFTYYTAAEPNGSWVGMDFGKPVNIEKINYAYRGDGNTIVIGNEYELMYWVDNQWKSLGKQIARSVSLTYFNCPANALFLLHNLTTGIEERIFTYENGEQIWW